MACRGRGCRGRPRGYGPPPPPIFDPQAFIETMGATVATIVQAGVVGGQGGMGNLQRFRAHHSLTFKGGGDPLVADHWFRHIERVLEAMEITSAATRIRLAAFQLAGESLIWWDWVKTSRNVEAMTCVTPQIPGVR